MKLKTTIEWDNVIKEQALQLFRDNIKGFLRHDEKAREIIDSFVKDWLEKHGEDAMEKAIKRKVESINVYRMVKSLIYDMLRWDETKIDIKIELKEGEET
jgi:hypothetical protein